MMLIRRRFCKVGAVVPVYGITGPDTVVPPGQVVKYEYYIHPELRI